MARNERRWTVLEHGPIEELSPRVRRVEGAVPKSPLRRVMTVVKDAGGDLIIHSGICLGDEAMAALEAWGRPRMLVVPGAQHRLDAAAFVERYPDLRVICPKGARTKVEEVVPVDLTYDEWSEEDAVSFEHFDGTGRREGIMHVLDEDGRTLVVNDIIFNMPHQPGLSGLILKYLTRSSGGPRVSRLARWFFVDDRQALRAHIERLATLDDLRRVICSHHQVMDPPAAALQAAARTV